MILAERSRRIPQSDEIIRATPSDPTESLRLARAVLNGKHQYIISSPDGTHKRYQWADLGQLERVRLEKQEAHWGNTYRHYHQEILRPTFETMPENILVIGAGENADQIKALLDIYKQAKITVIELHPENKKGAMANLRKTHLKDIEDGRVDILTGDAIDIIPALEACSFDLVEADKVAIHLNVAQREEFYNAMAYAVSPSGVVHLSDLHAKGWTATAAEGFEDNQQTQQALAVLGKLMPALVDNSWEKRGCPLWDNIGSMAQEVLASVPDLEVNPDLAVAYESPITGLDTKEGEVSILIAATPAAQIDALRARGDSEELQRKSAGARNLGTAILDAFKTPGVQITLPENYHLAFTPKAA